MTRAQLVDLAKRLGRTFASAFITAFVATVTASINGATDWPAVKSLAVSALGAGAVAGTNAVWLLVQHYLPGVGSPLAAPPAFATGGPIGGPQAITVPAGTVVTPVPRITITGTQQDADQLGRLVGEELRRRGRTQ